MSNAENHAGADRNPQPRSWITGCVRDRAGLHNLALEWSQLLDRSGCENVFLSFEWISGVESQWSKGQELFVITVREPLGRLVALAPFCVAPSVAGPRAVRFLSEPPSLAPIARRRVFSPYWWFLIVPVVAIGGVVVTLVMSAIVDYFVR